MSVKSEPWTPERFKGFSEGLGDALMDTGEFMKTNPPLMELLHDLEAVRVLLCTWIKNCADNYSVDGYPDDAVKPAEGKDSAEVVTKPTKSLPEPSVPASQRTCVVCGKSLEGRRPQVTTCSNTCRVAKSRSKSLPVKPESVLKWFDERDGHGHNPLKEPIADPVIRVPVTVVDEPETVTVNNPLDIGAVVSAMPDVSAKGLHALVSLKSIENLLPKANAESDIALRECLMEDGCRDAIEVFLHKGNLTIIDGHHRYKICHELKIPFKFWINRDVCGIDVAKRRAIEIQLGRRNDPPNTVKHLFKHYFLSDCSLTTVN